MKKIVAVTVLVSLTWPAMLMAQPNPDVPMYIKANVVEMDEFSGLFTYQGEVRVEQVDGAGITRLQADKLTLHSADDGVDNIVATGDPVKYQERGANQIAVDAVGQRFEYLRATEEIVVSGDARVERAGNVLRGERVVYDLREQKVTVPGANTGETSSRRGVEAVIVPNSSFFEGKADARPAE